MMPRYPTKWNNEKRANMVCDVEKWNFDYLKQFGNWQLANQCTFLPNQEEVRTIIPQRICSAPEVKPTIDLSTYKKCIKRNKTAAISTSREEGGMDTMNTPETQKSLEPKLGPNLAPTSKPQQNSEYSQKPPPQPCQLIEEPREKRISTQNTEYPNKLRLQLRTTKSASAVLPSSTLSKPHTTETCQNSYLKTKVNFPLEQCGQSLDHSLPQPPQLITSQSAASLSLLLSESGSTNCTPEDFKQTNKTFCPDQKSSCLAMPKPQLCSLSSNTAVPQSPFSSNPHFSKPASPEQPTESIEEYNSHQSPLPMPRLHPRPVTCPSGVSQYPSPPPDHWTSFQPCHNSKSRNRIPTKQQACQERRSPCCCKSRPLSVAEAPSCRKSSLCSRCFASKSDCPSSSPRSRSCFIFKCCSRDKSASATRSSKCHHRPRAIILVEEPRKGERTQQQHNNKKSENRLKHFFARNECNH